MKRARLREQDAPGIQNILDACRHSKLFGPWFRNRASWGPWFAFLAALFALPMTEEQLATYRECTGRQTPPDAAAQEAWLICGRRAGKSFILALVAVFLACFKDWRQYLAPGERGTIMVIAADRRQARIIIRYIRALLKVPYLSVLIERELQESFDLDNDITIEVHVASFRSTRGYSIVAALLDELAFWPTDDAAEPDFEVINALMPGMAQFCGQAILLCASSPYAKRGALYEAHRKHFGKESDPILIWQAATRTMNPSIPQSFIDQQMERDSAAASAEYGAQFRSDLEDFISREVVMACVDQKIGVRDPQPGLHYKGFVDMAGGTGGDSSSLAITHKDADSVLVDLIEEVRGKHSPQDTVKDFAAILKRYGVSKVVGDRYAGDWPVQEFKKHGITYEVADRFKSDIYLNALPLLTSQRARLLDNQRLINQLCGLERRTARGGRDSIDHRRNSHDDIANVVCGALLLGDKPRPRARLLEMAPPYDMPGYDFTAPARELDPVNGGLLDPAPRSLVVQEGDRIFLRVSRASNECIPGPGVKIRGFSDVSISGKGPEGG